MALPLRQIEFRVFGGGNWADPALSIMRRSHAYQNGVWQQFAPVEASNLRNVDFSQRALTKRRGQTLIDDSSSVHAASETILGGFAAGGHQFLVGAKSMYRKASGGSWARMQASGGGDYSHNATAAKWSVAIGDGYAFVGLDGANKIQVVDPGSATLKPALDNGNNYTEQKGGGTQTVTGTWGTGYYIVIWFQNRLLFSTGDSVFEYTDVNEPWDLLDGGFWQAKDDIVAAQTFIPRGQNELIERLFVFSKSGPQIITGFDLSDIPTNIEGGGVPVSHRCVRASQDWVIYPTEQQTIEAINLVRFIDLGRRMFNGDGTTGPLDNFDPSNSNHATKTFAFYDRTYKNWSLWGPDGASRSTVSTAWVVDMQLGEPGITELQESFERKVRNLWWQIKDPADNAWIIDLYQYGSTVVGVTSDGKTYTYNSGRNDLGAFAVVDYWDSPEIDGNAAENVKKFRRNALRSEDRGNWLVYIDYALNGTSDFTSSWSFTQAAPGSSFIGSGLVGTATVGEAGRASGNSWLEVAGETIKLRLRNENLSEDWQVSYLGLEYQLGRKAA